MNAPHSDATSPASSDMGDRDAIGLDDRFGPRDDAVGSPSVTPGPAPADDSLFRLAGAAAVGAAFGAIVLAWWLRRHVEVRWTW